MSNNTRGRPLKFKSVKELQKKIDEYFESCFEWEWREINKRDKNGKWITETKITKSGRKRTRLKTFLEKVRVQIEPFTITGLAIALDTTRELLCDYQKRDQFSDTIRRAKDIIVKSYEKRLIDRGNAGDIFAMKNFNWKDKSEIDNKVDENININVVNYGNNHSK